MIIGSNIKDKKKSQDQLVQDLELSRKHTTQIEVEREATFYFDDLPIGINLADIKGNFTYANRRFLEVTGYSKEEIIGKNIFKLGMLPSNSLKLLAKRMKDR